MAIQPTALMPGFVRDMPDGGAALTPAARILGVFTATTIEKAVSLRRAPKAMAGSDIATKGNTFLTFADSGATR
jgi:hypothetical protein